MKCKYAGSDWVVSMFPYWYKNPVKMSPLGEKVADILGELYYGIYHLEDNPLKKVEWENNHHITISINKHLSSYDNSELTRLVFLCHHMHIRVEIMPCNFSHITLMFHNRVDDIEDMYKYHPNIDDAVEKFKQSVTVIVDE